MSDMYSQNYKTFQLANHHMITISVAKQWIRVIIFGPSGRQLEQHKYATHFLNLELYEEEILAFVEDIDKSKAIVTYTEKILDKIC
jgi:hypothetical protein